MTSHFRLLKHTSIFPDTVLVCAAHFDVDLSQDTQYQYLLPEILNSAGAVRKAEYIAGRLCAQNALKDLGYNVQPFELPTNLDRTPKWPPGIIGSLSHGTGFAMAAVAIEGKKWRGLGVDSEPIFLDEVTQEIKSRIGTAREFSKLKYLDENTCTTLLFSAKEAVYKCLFPILKTFLEFEDLKLIEVHNEICKLVLKTIKPDLKCFTVECTYEILSNSIQTCAVLGMIS